MRLLLDAHLSGSRIGDPLRAAGHDVLVLAERPDLEGLDDTAVLVLAAVESRVLITRNSRDFAPILREWAELGRVHAGCILIWTLSHNEFGRIVTGVSHVLDSHPDPTSWISLAQAI